MLALVCLFVFDNDVGSRFLDFVNAVAVIIPNIDYEFWVGAVIDVFLFNRRLVIIFRDHKDVENIKGAAARGAGMPEQEDFLDTVLFSGGHLREVNDDFLFGPVKNDEIFETVGDLRQELLSDSSLHLDNHIIKACEIAFHVSIHATPFKPGRFVKLNLRDVANVGDRVSFVGEIRPKGVEMELLVRPVVLVDVGGNIVVTGLDYKPGRFFFTEG